MEIYPTGDGMRIVIVDLLQFHLDPAAHHVTCIAVRELSDSLIRYWFLQQILPILLLLDGSTELLHATAIYSEGSAIAFLGYSGIGKSTLLAHCLERGASLITDEHLALRRSDYTHAVPSLPYYRPYRSAEDLGLRARRFETVPRTLQAIYVLQPVDGAADVSVEPLANGEMIEFLLRNWQYNIFHPDMPKFFPVVQNRFAGLAGLVRRIPIKKLHVPRSLDRLPEVYDYIHQDPVGAS